MRALARRPARIVVVVVPTALALGLTSCSSDGTAAPAPLPTNTNPMTWSAQSIPSSQVDAAINALDGIANRTLSATGVPGLSIAVSRNGATAYAKGFGVRKAGTNEAVDADTTFQVASVSKPIGASVVASVVGGGQVSWTDPVSKYLPGFALSDPYVTKNATVGDFYSMRSGLPGEAGDDLELFGFNREQILGKFRYLPLTPFRAEYHYTNFGLTAGAQAVAQGVKTPWEELSKQRIYSPLAMTRTTSTYAEFLTQDNHATLHTKVGGIWGANQTRDPQAQSPAGGVSTSANDMAKWMTMELGDGTYQGVQVVAAESLQESRVPRSTSHPPTTPDSRSVSTGYGIDISTDGTGRVRYGYSGAFTAGAATNFALLPSENLGISVFTNAAPVGAAEAIVNEFLDLVETGTSTLNWLDTMGKAVEAIENPPLPTESPVPSPTEPAAATSAYQGVYANRYYGRLTIKATPDGLLATIGPGSYPIPMRHYNANVFATPPLAAPTADPARWRPTASFVVKGGKATNVTLDDLNANGLGTFTRQ